MKKFDKTTVLLILILLAGLSLLLYPTVSEMWNSIHQTHAIAGYTEVVAQMDDEDFTAFWEEAKAYNSTLKKRRQGYTLSKNQKKEYDRLLNVDGSGVMGYVEIPEIGVYLPVYHGTEEETLQVAIGHLEWTSLPVGGESTHCVVSGHRGLPSAKLFTDLDQMELGDRFMLHVLGETLTYEVDQILVVEPSDVKPLDIVEGQDLCTLFTCTPYGINTHRLLIRGYRVDNAPIVVERRVTADAVQMDSLGVAAVLAIPCVILGVIAMLAADKVCDAARKRKYKN